MLVAPVIFALNSDPSWRVRYACATQFVALCCAVGEITTKQVCNAKARHSLQQNMSVMQKSATPYNKTSL